MDPEVADGLNSNQKLGQEKRVLFLVNGRVDFDANKQNAGHKINRKEKYRVPYFLYLSIIGSHLHLHSELLT